jgi:hypothetical protein
MSLDAREAILLRRIERGLRGDAPGLAAAFDGWSSPDGDGRDGFTCAPAWVLASFLIGFTTWFIGPAAGLLVAAAGVPWACVARRPPRDPVRRARTPSPRHRYPPGPYSWPGVWGYI